MATKKMSKSEIEKEIAELQELVDAEGIPADEKELARGMISDLKKELSSAGEEKPAKKDESKKSSKPPKSKSGKKSPKSDTKKSKSETKPPKTSPKGKKSETKKKNEEPDCDELQRRFEARRKAAREAQNKTQTKSIFEKVAGKVESAVEGAIKSTDPEDMTEVKLKKMKRLKDAMEEFLQSFKEVLGDEYEGDEVKSAVAQIQKVIDKVEKQAQAGSDKE